MRSPCAADLLDEIEDDGHLVHAHPGGRFVEHEDVRFQRKQDRNLQLALIAVAEHGGGQPRALGQAHALQAGDGARGQLGTVGGEAEQMQADPGSGLHREADILQHREIGKEIRELEGTAKAAAGAQRRRERRDARGRAGARRLRWRGSGRRSG